MRRAVLTAAAAVLMLAVGASIADADGTPSRTKITFYFGLARPEAGARNAFFAVQQPGDGRYRRFLTPGQVSGRYGASPRTRAVFVRGMRRLGLSASVDRSGVFARVKGTVAQIERAFGVHVTVQVFDDPNSLVYSLPSGRLSLPSSLRPIVREVIPLSVRSVQTGAGAHDARGAASRPGVRPPLRAPAPSPPAPANDGTWIAGCSAARATGAYSFAQVRQAYGLGRVGIGAGGSVAFLTDAEGPAPGDIAASERCFGFPRGRVHLVFTDGQTAPFLPDTFEPLEDLALLRGMAPGLRSVYVSEAWGAESLWFLAAVKLLTFRQLPDALSISYGFCERSVLGRGADRVTRDGIALLDSVLVRLGLAGVGTFASAGDSGSSCNGLPFRGLAWPGSSPYLTSVGGSRLVLNAANQRVGEVVWNDLQWVSPDNGGGAGGGGVSGFYARPPFQRGVSIPGQGRGAPDVSAHASMLPGWPVVRSGIWVVDGGTSASAPLVASAFSVISAAQRAHGQPPLGPVNGLLFWLQAHQPASLFDIVSGSNGFFRRVPGWSAKPGYDLASGVGVPQFAAIDAGLPAPGREPATPYRPER